MVELLSLMDYDTVADYLIWTQKGRVNTAALDLGNNLVVIDAMRKREHAAEWRTIAENHFNQPVRALVLTHHHSDHTMGISVYSDLPIISSVDTKHLVAQARKKYITESFTDVYTLAGDTYTLSIVQTDGHTKGSSYGWVPEVSLLIAGDTIFNKMFPFGIDPSVDPVLWQQALREMVALEPELIIPGHGPAATFQDLQEIHEFFNQAVSFIRSKIEEGLTPSQIAKDPDCPEYYSAGIYRREQVKIQSFAKWAEMMRT